MGDSDDSYEFAHVCVFSKSLMVGADLMGNRFAAASTRSDASTCIKYLGNPVLSFLGRWLFRTPISDFHCGIRAFPSTPTSASICAPPAWNSPRDGRQDRLSSASAWSRSPPRSRRTAEADRHTCAHGAMAGVISRFLLMYSPRWLFFIPGLALMILGFALMIWLLPAERPLGHVNLGVDHFSRLPQFCSVSSWSSSASQPEHRHHRGLVPMQFEHWSVTSRSTRPCRGRAAAARWPRDRDSSVSLAHPAMARCLRSR